ncbi:MAG: hypothetical protein PARBA_00463 [Parabacteroides sp.]
MDNFVFSTPRICDCGGDLSKQWYVYFRGKNLLTGESKQFRFKLGINRYSKKRERQDAARAALRNVVNMLEVEGWNPFERQCDNIKKKDLNWMKCYLYVPALLEKEVLKCIDAL